MERARENQSFYGRLGGWLALVFLSRARGNLGQGSGFESV